MQRVLISCLVVPMAIGCFDGKLDCGKGSYKLDGGCAPENATKEETAAGAINNDDDESATVDGTDIDDGDDYTASSTAADANADTGADADMTGI